MKRTIVSGIMALGLVVPAVGGESRWDRCDDGFYEGLRIMQEGQQERERIRAATQERMAQIDQEMHNRRVEDELTAIRRALEK
jgi:hypothetical protein